MAQWLRINFCYLEYESTRCSTCSSECSITVQLNICGYSRDNVFQSYQPRHPFHRQGVEREDPFIAGNSRETVCFVYKLRATIRQRSPEGRKLPHAEEDARIRESGAGGPQKILRRDETMRARIIRAIIASGREAAGNDLVGESRRECKRYN